YSRDPGANGDPGRDAWQGECRGHDFYRSIQRIWTVRIWAHCSVVRNRAGSGLGGNRHAAHNRSMGLDLPGIAPGGPDYIRGKLTSGDQEELWDFSSSSIKAGTTSNRSPTIP